MARPPGPSVTAMSKPASSRSRLSKLVHKFDGCPATDAPLLLLLHDRQERMQHALEFAAPLREGARLVAIEAPKGVWHGKQIVGYTWYIGEPERPAPYSFGVSLSELELFLLDTIDRRVADDHALPYLLGIGQGADIALSIATVQPELISGVIAIDAHFPTVSGWDPPVTPIDGLPLLLIDRHDSGGSESVRERFLSWNALVERSAVSSELVAIDAINQWLESHPQRHDS